MVIGMLASQIGGFDFARDVLMAGQAPNVGALLWVSAESLAILIAALALYQRLNYWLAQRALTQ